jgi:hypothetical protein
MPIKVTTQEVRDYLSQYNIRLLVEYENSKSPMSFIDKDGYLYYMSWDGIKRSIASENNFKRSRFIIYNIYTIENIKNWLKVENKNFDLISDTFENAQSPLRFHCNNQNCNMDFESVWVTMLFNNSDCPFCIRPGIRSRLSDNNRLSVLRPDIAREWNYKRNSKSPDEYTVRSNEKVWWICECGHEWEAPISKRTEGRGCPTCAGKRVSDTNRLSVLYPELCDEWDWDKNIGSPSDYSFGSDKVVGWICPDCDNRYDARISQDRKSVV